MSKLGQSRSTTGKDTVLGCSQCLARSALGYDNSFQTAWESAHFSSHFFVIHGGPNWPFRCLDVTKAAHIICKIWQSLITLKLSRLRKRNQKPQILKGPQRAVITGAAQKKISQSFSPSHIISGMFQFCCMIFRNALIERSHYDWYSVCRWCHFPLLLEKWKGSQKIWKKSKSFAIKGCTSLLILQFFLTLFKGVGGQTNVKKIQIS